MAFLNTECGSSLIFCCVVIGGLNWIYLVALKYATLQYLLLVATLKTFFSINFFFIPIRMNLSADDLLTPHSFAHSFVLKNPGGIFSTSDNLS